MQQGNVKEWIYLFMGKRRAHRELLDWLAIAPKLERSLPALVLTGPPETGKTLLLAGIASIWHVNGIYSPLDVLFADNNALNPLRWYPVVYVTEDTHQRYVAADPDFLHTMCPIIGHPYHANRHLRFVFELNRPFGEIAPGWFLNVEADLAAAEYLRVNKITPADIEAYIRDLSKTRKAKAI